MYSPSLPAVWARLAELAPGVELLENLRFDAGEEGNDPAFVARLVEGIDAYVDDAFGACHRAHASIVGPPRTLPSAMGLLLQKEVEVLLGLRNDPKHPFVAVLGGSKISDKLGVVEALLRVVDSLVVGGAMCFTFLAAKGLPIGDSLFEPDQVETCRRLLAESAASGKAIHLPDDIVGVDWASAMTATPANAEGVTVPALVLTMSCHYLIVPDEIVFDHCLGFGFLAYEHRHRRVGRVHLKMPHERPVRRVVGRHL